MPWIYILSIWRSNTLESYLLRWFRSLNRTSAAWFYQCVFFTFVTFLRDSFPEHTYNCRDDGYLGENLSQFFIKTFKLLLRHYFSSRFPPAFSLLLLL